MFKKIESKIIAAIISCCIIVTLVQGVSTLLHVNETLRQDMENLTASVVSGNKNLIEQKIQTVRLIAGNISNMVTGIVDPDRMADRSADYEAILDPIVKKIVEDNINDVMGVYLILDPDKTDDVRGAYYEDALLTGSVQKMKKHEKKYFTPDNERMSWYYECIGLREGKWYEPYVTSGGIEMVSYTVPIYKDDVYVALLSIDLNFQQFKKYVTGIELQHSGHLFVLNEKFDFIMHRTLTFEDNFAEYNNRQYQAVADMMASGKQEIAELEFEGTPESMAYEKLSNGWYLCGVVSREALTRNNRELLVLTLRNFVIVLILSVVVAFVIGKTISTSTSYVTRSINTLSSLDLTINEEDRRRAGKKARRDELGVMIDSVIHLRGHLRHIIPKVIDNSKTTRRYADQIKLAMDESSAAMAGVSETMSRLTESSEQQMKNARRGVDQLGALTQTIETAVESANRMQTSLEETEKANENNRGHIDNLSRKFGAYVESSRQVSASVNALSEKTKDIGVIVKAIDSIAMQTKLLSLNASIEAARAGEHGKGFATVADEIRQLSDRTGGETSRIQSIVEDLSANMNVTVDNMRKGENALSGAQGAMEESRDSFGVIARDVSQMTEAAASLISATSKISKNKDEVAEAIHFIHDLSEENAAKVQSMTQAVESENRNIAKLAAASSDLTKISKDLDGVVSEFKI